MVTQKKRQETYIYRNRIDKLPGRILTHNIRNGNALYG